MARLLVEGLDQVAHYEALISDTRHSFTALTTLDRWTSVSCGYIGKETILADTRSVTGKSPVR